MYTHDVRSFRFNMLHCNSVFIKKWVYLFIRSNGATSNFSSVYSDHCSSFFHSFKYEYAFKINKSEEQIDICKIFASCCNFLKQCSVRSELTIRPLVILQKTGADSEISHQSYRKHPKWSKLYTTSPKFAIFWKMLSKCGKNRVSFRAFLAKC